MSLDSIRKAVTEASRTEASHIIDAAKRQAEEQLGKEKDLARRESELLYKGQARMIEEEHARKLVQFQGRAAKTLLEKRNGLLREIFDRAQQTILAWPSEKYEEVMLRLVQKAAGSSGGTLRVHPQDRNVFVRVIESFNKNRNTVNLVSLDENGALAERGGFIFVSADFEVDQTLTTLLADIERELLPAIARDLFPS
jgi:vacuolar-type H+-ATPase subunit E/Vma4